MNSNPTLYASCDEYYLRKYGVAFILSALDNHYKIHINAIQPQCQLQRKSLEHFFECICNATSENYGEGNDFTYAIEELWTNPNENIQALYASNRFFAASRDLYKYENGILIVDIDTLVQRKLVAKYDAERVGIYIRHDNIRKLDASSSDAISAIAAGCVYIPANTLGQKFLDSLCHELLTSPKVWFNDQLAMLKIYQVFDENSFFSINSIFMGWDKIHFDKSALWSAKGSKRKSISHYKQRNKFYEHTFANSLLENARKRLNSSSKYDAQGIANLTSSTIYEVLLNLIPLLPYLQDLRKTRKHFLLIDHRLDERNRNFLLNQAYKGVASSLAKKNSLQSLHFLELLSWLSGDCLSSFENELKNHIFLDLVIEHKRYNTNLDAHNKRLENTLADFATFFLPKGMLLHEPIFHFEIPCAVKNQVEFNSLITLPVDSSQSSRIVFSEQDKCLAYIQDEMPRLIDFCYGQLTAWQCLSLGWETFIATALAKQSIILFDLTNYHFPLPYNSSDKESISQDIDKSFRSLLATHGCEILKIVVTYSDSLFVLIVPVEGYAMYRNSVDHALEQPHTISEGLVDLKCYLSDLSSPALLGLLRKCRQFFDKSISAEVFYGYIDYFMYKYSHNEKCIPLSNTLETC